LVQVARVQQLELQQVQAAAIQFSQPFHQLAAVAAGQVEVVADFQVVLVVVQEVILELVDQVTQEVIPQLKAMQAVLQQLQKILVLVAVAQVR
jgi:hypothetical protein